MFLLLFYTSAEAVKLNVYRIRIYMVFILLLICSDFNVVSQ